MNDSITPISSIESLKVMAMYWDNQAKYWLANINKGHPADYAHFFDEAQSELEIIAGKIKELCNEKVR